MYYACYYPEGDDLSKQVASIVNYFRQSGYNVIMDVMVSEEMSSQGPTGWAESQIRKAKKVLVFLSPGLVNLAQDGRGVSSVSQVSLVLQQKKRESIARTRAQFLKSRLTLI